VKNKGLNLNIMIAVIKIVLGLEKNFQGAFFIMHFSKHVSMIIMG
jgi:hypothetical protein